MKKTVNYHFLILVSLMIIFGTLFLATLSAPQSLSYFGNTNYYLFHQLLALAIGFIFSVILYKTPLKFLKKIAPFLFAFNLLLLVSVFLPVIGTKFWGAKRWISLGGITLQPSEFLKITAILYIAAWLSDKFSASSKGGMALAMKKSYHNFIYVFLPFVLILSLVTAVFYFQNDVSTLGIIGATLIIMYFASGSPLWHTILAFLAGSASIALFIVSKPYRIERLKTLLHPELDPLGSGLQLKQSLIALGSGGILGKGWGMSTQKFGFLPQAMSDSVFAILGEETGILGCSVLVGLFLSFLFLGFKIAKSSSDKFSRLTAVGISSWITLQAFVNIASTIGIFPLSGIPLPFFSYGGSHLMAEMMGVGLLLNISKNG